MSAANKALKKRAEELLNGVKRDEANAADYEMRARQYRASEKANREALAETLEAIKQLEARERQIAIYGRVVTQ